MATKLLVMYVNGEYGCVFIAWTVHTSQSLSNSIEKRFYFLFFMNFAKVCIQAFRIEFLVLIYYSFNGNLRYLFNIFRETSVNTNMARGNPGCILCKVDAEDS